MKKFNVTLYRIVGEYAEVEIEVEDDQDEEDAIEAAKQLDAEEGLDWDDTDFRDMDDGSHTADLIGGGE